MKLIYLLLLILLMACSSVSHQVKVDGVSDGSTLKKYVLMSGSKEVSADDLRFKEFKNITIKVLNEMGFTEVTSEKEAEIAILLSYGVGSGVTHTELISGGMWDYSTPMRGRRGYYYPFGYRHYQTRSQQVTTYDHQIILDAVDVKSKKQVWETKIASKARTDDLRGLFSYMLEGAKKYIGQNTGKQVLVTVKEEDLK